SCDVVVGEVVDACPVRFVVWCRQHFAALPVTFFLSDLRPEKRQVFSVAWPTWRQCNYALQSQSQ
uniref:Uncharacterized protein n=1 Tax=Oryza brachyantha TaxID=4533 RepID=J3MA85_ORYBR